MPDSPAAAVRRAARLPRQRGAALLLLLAVAGVGAATLLVSALGGNRNDLARERRTLTQLGQANEALLGFALSHGRLPRPAISATDGRESPLPCASEQACTGFLPWVTLGIDGADAWGKLLRYSVTPAYAAYTVQAASMVADKRVLARDGSGRTYFVAGQAACTLDSQCMPAVVLSSGRRRLGTSAQGVPQHNESVRNSDEQQNNAGSNDFMQRPTTEDPKAPGGEFDDLVSWLPLRQLYLRMNAAGRLL